MYFSGSTNYALLLRAHPIDSAQLNFALDFCRALLRNGHNIDTLFFHGDATLLAKALVSQTKRSNLTTGMAAWREFAERNELTLLFCVSSAERRGIPSSAFPTGNADNPPASKHNIRIAGLGEWVEASLLADRVLSF